MVEYGWIQLDRWFAHVYCCKFVHSDSEGWFAHDLLGRLGVQHH